MMVLIKYSLGCVRRKCMSCVEGKMSIAASSLDNFWAPKKIALLIWWIIILQTYMSSGCFWCTKAHVWPVVSSYGFRREQGAPSGPNLHLLFFPLILVLQPQPFVRDNPCRKEWWSQTTSEEAVVLNAIVYGLHVYLARSWAATSS